MINEEREIFNQDEFFLRQALKLDSSHVYIENDLVNEKILNRAIDLLHHKLQSQRGVIRIVTVHINYDALSEEFRASAFQEADIAMNKEGAIRLEQKKKAMSRLALAWNKANKGTELHTKSHV